MCVIHIFHSRGVGKCVRIGRLTGYDRRPSHSSIVCGRVEYYYFLNLCIMCELLGGRRCVQRPFFLTYYTPYVYIYIQNTSQAHEPLANIQDGRGNYLSLTLLPSLSYYFSLVYLSLFQRRFFAPSLLYILSPFYETLMRITTCH